MTRAELYNSISPCGGLSYLDMVYLLGHVSYTDPSIGYALLQRLSQSGTLSQYDWILFGKSVIYMAGSPINGATIESWLTGKCNLDGLELRTFLDYVTFTDGTEPTYLLTQNGDILVAE